MSRRCLPLLLGLVLLLVAGPAAADEESETPETGEAVPALPFVPNPYLEHGFGGFGGFGMFGIPESAPPVLAGSGTDSLLRAPDLRGSNAPTLLERYGSQGLTLDGGAGSMSADQGLGAIASGVFAIAAWLAHAVVATVQWAFSIELFDFVGGAVAGIVGSLRDTLYLPFVQAAVIIGGLYALWHGLVRRRGTFAAEGLTWTVFALAAAAVFFTFPGALVSGANHVSTGLARTVLAGVSAVDPKVPAPSVTGAAATFEGHAADAQLRVAADRFWRVFVYQPWLVLQFGEAEAGAAYGERLLAARTITAEEYAAVAGDPEAVQELSDRKSEEYLALQEEVLADPELAPWFRGRRPVDRLGVATLALVGVLVGGVLLAVVAAAVLLAQIAFLLLVLVGPFVLLLGIHPGAGRVIALRWAELSVGLLVKRVALGTLLAVVLVVNGLLLEATQSLGWLVAMGLQALVIAAVIVYRKSFARLFAPATVPRIATDAARQLAGRATTVDRGQPSRQTTSALWNARTRLSRRPQPTSPTAARAASPRVLAAPPQAKVRPPLRRRRRTVRRAAAAPEQAGETRLAVPGDDARPDPPSGNGHGP